MKKKKIIDWKLIERVNNPIFQYLVKRCREEGLLNEEGD